MGIYFPVLTNPSIYCPFDSSKGFFLLLLFEKMNWSLCYSNIAGTAKNDFLL